MSSHGKNHTVASAAKALTHRVPFHNIGQKTSSLERHFLKAAKVSSKARAVEAQRALSFSFSHASTLVLRRDHNSATILQKIGTGPPDGSTTRQMSSKHVASSPTNCSVQDVQHLAHYKQSQGSLSYVMHKKQVDPA